MLDPETHAEEHGLIHERGIPLLSQRRLTKNTKSIIISYPMFPKHARAYVYIITGLYGYSPHGYMVLTYEKKELLSFLLIATDPSIGPPTKQAKKYLVPNCDCRGPPASPESESESKSASENGSESKSERQEG